MSINAPTHTSRRAVISLVLSLCLGPVGAIPGVIFGHLARRDIKRNQNLKGARLATAGLILGYIFIALTILYFALFDVTGDARPQRYLIGSDGPIPIGSK